jgi:hypothetical protein
MLPNFFVIGAQKSGTTALHHYLICHPDIYLPEGKETKFFADDSRFARGLEHYEKTHFSGWGAGKAVGEIDPDYMFFDNAMKRIADCLDISKIKFVMLLRNPAERAFSHYLMTYRRGLETRPFEEAIALENKRLKGGEYFATMHFSYVSRGYYYTQIQRVLKHIDPSQLMITFTEDLKNSPEKYFRSLFFFLRVDETYVPENLNESYHRARVPRSPALLQRMKKNPVEKKIFKMLIPSKKIRQRIYDTIYRLNLKDTVDLLFLDETRAKLLEMYEEEVYKLEELTGRKLNGWR